MSLIAVKINKGGALNRSSSTPVIDAIKALLNVVLPLQDLLRGISQCQKALASQSLAIALVCSGDEDKKEVS